MNIQAEKLQLMKMNLETDNPRVLEAIKKLFRNEHKVDLGIHCLMNKSKK